MIRRMRWGALLLVAAFATCDAGAQCAPAPDSSYFFRDLTQRRADAKLAADRAFFEKLLSATFVNRAAFIEGELVAEHARPEKAAAVVRNFSLLEHRKGFVVTSYQLVDGSTERWFRDVYEVEDGQWRLASSEIAPPAAHQAGGT